MIMLSYHKHFLTVEEKIRRNVIEKPYSIETINLIKLTSKIKTVTRSGYMIKGFKMKLFPGKEKEYEKRHNLLWPEMKEMIHEYGGKNYTIFFDRETLTLFGYIEIESEEKWEKSADTEICKKWWDYMADIMETNPDNSPVSIELKNVFHLD